MTILAIALALAHQDVTKQRTAASPARPEHSVTEDEASPIEHVPIQREAPVTSDRSPVELRRMLPPPPPRPVPMPPAPPAPPAPPRPLIGTPLRPSTPPQSWVTNDDYPATAIREGAQGTVGFRLDVDAAGVVANCTVTSSSGSALLDTETCRLMRARASFRPARDLSGKAIAAPFASRFRWELPEPAREPLTSWTARLRYVVGDDGTILSCTPTLAGAVPEATVDCADKPAADLMIALRGGARGPVTVLIGIDQRVDGMPMPRVPGIEPGLRPDRLVEIAFQVDAEGEIQDCRTIRTVGDLPPDPCSVPEPFEPPAAGTAPRKVTQQFAIHTNAPLPAKPAP